jgi:diadenosine tetraphosphate (Ap4A) HIT family hydrolase
MVMRTTYLFCSCTEKVLENDLAFAIYDSYPVSEGHMLIIPKRHVSSCFEITAEERLSILELLNCCRQIL